MERTMRWMAVVVLGGALALGGCAMSGDGMMMKKGLVSRKCQVT